MSLLQTKAELVTSGRGVGEKERPRIAGGRADWRKASHVVILTSMWRRDPVVVS